MHYNSAHRKAWGLAVALVVCVVAAKWTTGDLDVGWVVRLGLILAAAALIAIGYGLRQRALDETAMTRILEVRLNRETSDLRE